MKRLENRLIGIDQGELVLFSDYESNGEMWTGAGERTRRHSVRFAERYKAPPAVHVALSMWDIDANTNARMEISAENVTERGFDCVFRTWSDTHIARARMRWMSIGELVHEDEWDLY
ncbi:H-type lectin domain-containing protein [Roseovarius sp. SCSIO 43702]|uniref:H-type lectin domain-containing protein n=1 Tax=Roseovarius sp. SCSIO 43702 TaxID=2823043 RepID=UPI001C72EF42|nr:H-type lectin domain-containing protein [Roseovarius sp. SCSIO 43702]QYX57705.1 H-type lectin domain-containing protein [Roseovarius sp. SCSIO 43702]